MCWLPQMAALLIYDLRNPDSPANPKNKLPGNNPIHLTTHGSFHGGIWRGAYQFDTIGTLAAVQVYLKWYLPYLGVAAGAQYAGLLEMAAQPVVAATANAMALWSE